MADDNVQQANPGSRQVVVPANAPTPQAAKLGDFIEKEQAEVYLLMDFLSGRAAIRLRDEKISVPDLKAPKVNGIASLMERPLVDVVCEVRWPYNETYSDSYIAAVLLKARDRLSEIASPASGASIAFTTFVTNAMSHEIKAAKEASCNQEEKSVMHRVIVENARLAYPDYQSLARDFNARRHLVGIALPSCLVVTLIASLLLSYFSVCASPSMGGCPVHDHSRLVKVLQEQGLPVCYGLVGALTGVLRGVQIKIRDGLLMPRDRMYIIMQLWLGVVMGATIGLFSIDAGAGVAAVSGVKAIAPPALSFAAGLGVDSVFIWFETLIKAVFGHRANTAA